MNSFNSELHFQDTQSAIRKKLEDLLTEFKGLKFVMTSVLEFRKIESDDETKYSSVYLSSKAETVINDSDVDDVFASFYSTIMSNIQKFLEKAWVGLLVHL